MASHDQNDPLRDPLPPTAGGRDQREMERTLHGTHRASARGDAGRREAAPAVAGPRRRRGLPFWLTTLALVLVAGWALARLTGRDGGAVAASYPGTPAGAGVATASGGEVAGGGGIGASSAAAGGAVAQFASWANEGGNQALPAESEANHPYTSQGIRLLADALAQASTAAGTDHAARVETIRARATQLQTAEDDDRHAQYAHAAFVDAARLIGELQGARGAGGADLTTAAGAIDPEQPLSPQGTQVRAFFRQAASALQGLGTR